MSTDDTSSHILQIVNNCNLFFKIYENTQWTRRATAETIKTSFKLASFIERVIESLKGKGILSEFVQLLKNWLWKNEKKYMTYQVEFLEFASDNVLEILLFNRAITITSSDIALRIYTSLYSVERLEIFFKSRILKHSSYDVLQSAIIESSCDPIDIEARMILKEWEKLINGGGIEAVKLSIQQMFSNYRLNKSLPVLLKILYIREEDNPCVTDIQSSVMERLQEKLIDRTTLNKDFWNFLFKQLSVSILADVCLHNRIVTDMLFNFIEYTGSMMNVVFVNSQKTWISNTDFSLYPEITYTDLFKVIKALHGASDATREVVLLKISDAYKNSSSELWEDILFSL